MNSEIATMSNATQERDRLRADVAEWSQSNRFDTRNALAIFPQLQFDKSLMLELIYDEYLRRIDAGVSVDPAAFADEFPDYRNSVQKIVFTHGRLLSRRPELEQGPNFRWPQPGDQFDDYQILRMLGRGGFAHVYLAVNTVTGRQEVLKVAAKKTREARVMGRLDHPNVVPILGARNVDDTYLVISMPFDGCSTLADYLDRGAANAGSEDLLRALDCNIQPSDDVPAERGTAIPKHADRETVAVFLAAEMACGLEYLHEQGIYHLDLKPTNVILSWSGRPILADFNLAVDTSIDLTHCGGTLYHMAPEQIAAGINGEKNPPLDARTDLFAFGAIVYELLSGQHPFSLPLTHESQQGKLTLEAFAAWLLAQQQSGCAPLRQVTPTIDAAFARLVDRCLRFDPSERPQSAREVLRELNKLRAWPHRLRRSVNRHQRAIVVTTCALCLAAGVGAYLMPRSDGGASVSQVNLLDTARSELREKRPQQAIAILDELIRQEPKNAEAYLHRGVARYRLHDKGTAKVDLETARVLAPDERIHAALAYVYAAAFDFEMALNSADRSAHANCRSAEAFNNRAFVRIVRNRFVNNPIEQAAILSDLNRAVEIDPKLPAAHLNRARFHFQMWVSSSKLIDLEHAERSVRAGFECAAPSHELYRLGAIIVAERSAIGLPDWETVLEWLRIAIELGSDPSGLAKNHSFDPIKSRPEFQRLLQIPVVLSREFVSPGLADPLPFDLTSRTN